MFEHLACVLLLPSDIIFGGLSSGIVVGEVGRFTKKDFWDDGKSKCFIFFPFLALTKLSSNLLSLL